MTLVRLYDPCANHSDDEADEHNHEAPRNICAGIANEKDLKNEDIKEELDGKSPSSYTAFEGDNFWRYEGKPLSPGRLMGETVLQGRLQGSGKDYPWGQGLHGA